MRPFINFTYKGSDRSENYKIIICWYNDINMVEYNERISIGQKSAIFQNYIEENYIGAIRRGRFRRPRFPYALWDVYDRVLNSLPRTNNAVEGWPTYGS